MASAQLISTDRKRAIVGLGVTGQSVARHLHAKGVEFSVFDTRREHPDADLFRESYPEASLRLGPLSAEDFDHVDEVVLSPGLCSNSGVFPALRERGISIVSDIELFAREASAPVIAITGSNAKSTVTSLVGLMAEADGKETGVGGNLGVPALDLLGSDRELYVLELSSFQLEITQGLRADVACILNLSEDHMDRYDSMLSYHQAKQRIYLGARHVVCNRADPLTMPLLEQGQTATSFGLNSPDLKQFGVLQEGEKEWLSRGVEKLMDAEDVAIKGRHNLTNALAALAIGDAAGFSLKSMTKALREFRGLPHRCETISESSGVVWIDDSKATNAGAVIAALDGLADGKNIVLIAGGQSKGQDFDALADCILRSVKQLVLLGEDARQIAQAVEAKAESQYPIVYAVSMAAAVQAAADAAEQGDTVLLSPACASFDMFDGYVARGKAFVEAVEALH